MLLMVVRENFLTIKSGSVLGRFDEGIREAAKQTSGLTWVSKIDHSRYVDPYFTVPSNLM